MSFDPDAYIASKSGGGGFDPDAYLASKGEEAPAPYMGPGMDVSGLRAGANADLRGAVRGFLDMVPGSHKFIAATQGEPVEAVDKRYADELEQSPTAFRAGQAGALVALPGPKNIAGMAGLGAAQAAGDARGDFKDTLRQAGFGTIIGGALGGVGRVIAKPVSMIAEKALPYLERLEQKYAGKVMDASVKPAEATLRSATGTLGSLTAEGSRTLERLGMKEGLPAADRAANEAALATPHAQALASDLAGKSRDKLPGQLDRIEAGRGLVDQATQDVASAKAPEALAATEQRMRGYANDTLLKRYLLPAGAGLAAGELLGGDHNHTAGAAGLGLGLGARPMLRAIVRQATNPGYAAPLTRAAVSTAQKLAGMASSQPELLGKFAAPLAHAAGRGDDAVAAMHYVLNQDPEYQQLAHDASGDQQ